MSLLSLRPTFEMQLPHPKAELVRRVQSELRKQPWNSTSLVFDDYVEIHIPRSELRYWSPHLSLSFDGDEKHTHVLGRFAPRQEVWTLVWILYLLLAFTAFFGLIFAYAEWILGQSSWIGVASLVAIAGIIILYLVSFIGQRLSSDQMHQLRTHWSDVLGNAYPPVSS
jgi:hypothetical protein